VIEQPPCAVQATTREGQRWVAGTIEAGIAALGWKRPTRACAEDPKPATAAAPPAAAPAKRTLLQRLRGR